MKIKHIFFLFLASGFLWSCNQATVSEKTEQPPGDITNAQEFLSQPSTQPKKTAEIEDPASRIVGTEWKSYFEGSLGNGKIGIEIYLHRHGDMLRGNISYKRRGIPIRVYGHVNGDNSFFMREYAKGTEVSGSMSGKIENGELNGTWYAPSGETNYPLSVKASTKRPKHQNWPDATQTVKGVYSYTFPNDGGSGSLTVKQDGDQIEFDAISVNSAPGYHIATIEEGKGTIVDHVVHYSMNGGDCEFNIRFFKDFAYIEFVDEHWECDFGQGASIEGVFVREPWRKF